MTLLSAWDVLFMLIWSTRLSMTHVFEGEKGLCKESFHDLGINGAANVQWCTGSGTTRVRILIIFLNFMNSCLFTFIFYILEIFKIDLVIKLNLVRCIGYTICWRTWGVGNWYLVLWNLDSDSKWGLCRLNTEPKCKKHYTWESHFHIHKLIQSLMYLCSLDFFYSQSFAIIE